MTLPVDHNFTIYSIQEVASILQVSTHTLRNWEREGKIYPSFRTESGHRRYTDEDLVKIKAFQEVQNSKTSLIQSPALPVPNYSKITLKASGNKLRRAVAFTSALATFGVLLASLYVWSEFKEFNKASSEDKNFASNFEDGLVLSSHDILDRMASFNVSSFFTKDVNLSTTLNVKGTSLFEDNITAPNVIYGIVAGEGVEISEGQTPTISASAGGVTSLQGETGDLTLEEGTGIQIDGLTIESVADLDMVYANGGCSECLTDDDIEDELTISDGGSVSGTAIDNGTVAATVGGTGITTYTTGDILYASAENTLS